MPALLSASPVILDHSFPRSIYQLQSVAETLGIIHELVTQDNVHLILPETLADFILEPVWEGRTGQEIAILNEIYRLLMQWFLSPNKRLIKIDVSSMPGVVVHPLPEDVSNVGWTDLWAEEIGKLQELHDQRCGDKFCIGIACERAFTEGILSEWDNPLNIRTFPLVGPELSDIENAYEWEQPPSDISRKLLPIADALKNVNLLGASEVIPPDGDSHYKINFPGKRPWTLSKNDLIGANHPQVQGEAIFQVFCQPLQLQNISG